MSDQLLANDPAFVATKLSKLKKSHGMKVSGRNRESCEVNEDEHFPDEG